jgi:hypothetical protein
MGCNCGGSPATPASNVEYSVTGADGRTYDGFKSEPEARIKAVMVNGRVTVVKK